jgi:hypothetical protein
MKKLASGFFQAILSVIIGFGLTAAAQFCVKERWIPSYSIVILSVVNFTANVFTLRKVRGWGIFYTLGWLAGAFLFNEFGLFGTFDIIFNIIAPICILFARFVLWVKDSSRKVYSRR